MVLASEQVELAPELQERIREFARRLSSSDFYEVLGAPRDADEAGIRRAFSERSKDYHPDRYYGKQLGPYAGLLHEIFKRVAAAYEVLRDPQLRTIYDRTLQTAIDQERREVAARVHGATTKRRPATGLAALRRQLDLTRSKARRHYDEAMLRLQDRDLSGARSLLRLALIFDPREPLYQAALGEVVMNAGLGSADGDDVEEVR